MKNLWNKCISWLFSWKKPKGCKYCNHECHCLRQKRGLDCLRPDCDCISCGCA